MLIDIHYLVAIKLLLSVSMSPSQVYISIHLRYGILSNQAEVMCVAIFTELEIM